jgi:hypothetical protein
VAQRAVGELLHQRVPPPARVVTGRRQRGQRRRQRAALHHPVNRQSGQSLRFLHRGFLSFRPHRGSLPCRATDAAWRRPALKETPDRPKSP